MAVEIREMLSTELLKILNEDRVKQDRTPINHAQLLTIIKQKFNFAKQEENLKIKKIYIGDKEKKVLLLTERQVREILLREHEEYRITAVKILERVNVLVECFKRNRWLKRQ